MAGKTKSEEQLAAEEAEAIEAAAADAAKKEVAAPDLVNDGRSIHQRMIAIIAELPAIGKAQYNEQQKFHFRGHDDVLNALTPLLSKHGVVIIPRVIDRAVSQRITRSNAIMYGVDLHIEFTCYGAAGDHITGSAWGEGTDMGDKSTMKAGTMAFKAFLNQSFAINTEEGAKHDADKNTPEETVRQDVRVEPAIRPPQSWSEALKRFDDLMGRVGDGAAWLEELTEVQYGVTTLADLDSAQKRKLLIGFSSAMMLLEERYGDLALMPGVRSIIAGAFAEKNEGAVLEGPAWPLDPKEAEERGEPVGWAAKPADEPEEAAAATAADSSETKEGEEE